jgi:hypothetical protein
MECEPENVLEGTLIIGKKESHLQTHIHKNIPEIIFLPRPFPLGKDVVNMLQLRWQGGSGSGGDA